MAAAVSSGSSSGGGGQPRDGADSTNPSTAQTGVSPAPPKPAPHGASPEHLSPFTPPPSQLSCSFCSPFSPPSSRGGLSPGKNGSYLWGSWARRETLGIRGAGVGKGGKGQDFQTVLFHSGLHYGQELFHAPRLRGGVRGRSGGGGGAAQRTGTPDLLPGEELGCRDWQGAWPGQELTVQATDASLRV